MNFPLSYCPSCGETGYNVTSLSDKFFRYICTNLDCPGPVRRWSGERNSDIMIREESKRQLDALYVTIIDEVHE